MTDKRKQAMRDAASRYEARFGMPLLTRVTSLIEQYPNVIAPNWLSWEGHKFTNAADTRALRRWQSVLADEYSVPLSRSRKFVRDDFLISGDDSFGGDTHAPSGAKG